MAEIATESARQKFFVTALYLLPVVLAAAALFELFQLVHLSLFYASTGIIGDEPLYFAMGRGLLNGFHFYIDLFETKPPMVFWLAALSLLTTSGDNLYRFIQVAGLTAIPIALLALTIHVNRSYPLLLRLLTGGAALLFGAAIASFAVTRSVGYQTEGFGIVPSSVALLCAARYLTVLAPNTPSHATQLDNQSIQVSGKNIAPYIFSWFVLQSPQRRADIPSSAM